MFDCVPRPDPGSAQSIATTPSPKEIRMKQPTNSAHSSTIRPCSHRSGSGPKPIDSAAVLAQPPAWQTFGSGMRSRARAAARYFV